MTNGDRRSPRPPLCCDDALAALGEAAQRWGCDVPKDPGAGELADELVGRLRVGQRDERFSSNAAEAMAEVAEALGAVSRLGGLLPAVALWHLRAAVETADRQLAGAEDEPGGLRNEGEHIAVDQGVEQTPGCP
ncbi:hypothetical protein [Streptomyces sp. SM12]|uniref:hypothetical protein n=1 Tax=Streptomyces sp. SM12 TaxID=1071602 RepID=UPI0011B084DB|nr:hypothetical protein [Streptomyces sp. SM12]